MRGVVLVEKQSIRAWIRGSITYRESVVRDGSVLHDLWITPVVPIMRATRSTRRGMMWYNRHVGAYVST